MTYATLQQLTDRYGASLLVLLTDHEEIATGTIKEEVINRALADTDAVINGFLQDRYRLPLAEIPPMLADIGQSIAIWKLHRTKPDDKVETDYKEAMSLLRDIAKGTVRLSVDGVEPTGTGSAGIRITDRERPLTAENLKGFI